VTPLTSLAGVGAKTIEKIEAAGITSVEKLAGMTPEQLMEIPGIGEKMVDKIYQAVNRFYEGGTEAAAATGEAAASTEAPAQESEATIVEAAETSKATEAAEAPEAAGAAEEAAAAEDSAAEAAPAGADSEGEQAEKAKS
jgi:N utilization substance protein A